MNTREPIVITLSDVEQRIVRYIALARQTANREAGVRDGKRAPASTDADLLGYAGEFAFSKYFNCYPDLTTEPRRGGADCERFGEAIDVKTRSTIHGDLLVIPSKVAHAIDRYALLVAPNWPSAFEFHFVGWAAPADIFTPDHLGRLSTGETYIVRQDELQPNQLPPRREDD